MAEFFSDVFAEYCVHSVLNWGCAAEVLTLHMSQTFLWPHLSLSKINSRLSFPLCVSLHYPFTPSQQVFHISVGFSKDQLPKVKILHIKVSMFACVFQFWPAVGDSDICRYTVSILLLILNSDC